MTWMDTSGTGTPESVDSSDSPVTAESAAVFPRYSIVIPTVGRPCLERVLNNLSDQETDDAHPAPERIVVVDDRRPDATPLPPLPLPPMPSGSPQVVVVRGHGLGPAHARNRGWRVTTSEWVAFVDDDVELPTSWVRELVDDLRSCTAQVGGTQGRVTVPLPADRRPTDWERNTVALENSAWTTADMAYRRAALFDVEGFDERFPRAYREDADLALRVIRAGWDLVVGERRPLHPVRPAGLLVSARVQAGNADDPLMHRLHGRHWRREGQIPVGAFPWHVATVSTGTLALAAGTVAVVARLFGGAAHGTSERAGRLALSAGAAWALAATRFVVHRLAPGPRPSDPRFPREFVAMTMTSLLIPPLAVGHHLAGAWRHRRAEPWPPRPKAVLLDRDGTLVHDVPYNTDPARVIPVDGAREALDRLRRAGLQLAVVSNQSAIGRGIATADQVEEVDARVADLLGPFDVWHRCPHVDADGCDCRKPAPGLVRAAAHDLGVDAAQCVVIGDIGADVEAALAAGARPILVPTEVTRGEEIFAAPWVVGSLDAAVDLVLERLGR